MNTRSILLLVLSSSALSLIGCGPRETGPSIPDQASYCSPDFLEDFPETRQVDLGVGPPSEFAPYGDGEEVELITGGQGASMITPVVRVEKGTDDGPEPCFRVRVVESPSENASEQYIQFYEEGGYLFSDGALYFLTYSAGDVQLALTVNGKGFSGTKSVSVVLQ